MLGNQNGTIVIFCDVTGCSYEQIFDLSEGFTEAMKEARKYGWVMQRDKETDEWFHKCPGHEGE